MILTKLKALFLIPNLRIRSLNKYILKMNQDKAYLRYLNESEQFKISFQYKNNELKLNRQFNLMRNNSEPVSQFLSRINANIEKAVSKKVKQQSKPAEIRSYLSVDNCILKDETVCCKDVFTENRKITLHLLDKEFLVLVNTPWVDVLALPNCLLTNFPVYLKTCELLFTTKEQSEFHWFKSKDKNDWTEIGTSFIYTPKNEDCDCYLKLSCLPKNGQLEGPLTETVSSGTVQKSRERFPFQLRHQFTQDRLSGKLFRMVSYNILADLYCDSDYTRQVLFPYCRPHFLNIEYRKQLVVRELLGFNADIMCLQEVDKKIHNFFQQIFTEYACNFAQKGGEVTEGLAFYYNKNRFKAIHFHRIVLGEEIETNPIFHQVLTAISVNDNLKNRLLARTTVLQVNVIESVENDEILVVANTHLYFHPESDNIRLIQAGLVSMFVENLVKSLREKFTKRISVVICGDFNSTPDCGIYQLFTSGQLSENCIDFQSNAEEVIDNINFSQSFQMDSACGIPKFTTVTDGFSECIDYIFYDKNNLEVEQFVPFPSEEELKENTALPSAAFPSDHISLVSDLKWL